MKKRIETETIRVGDLKTDFGNPRKISKKKKDELKESLESLGDFGLIVVNDKNQVLCGNQRVTILKEENEDTEVLCKKLIGYTVAEQKAINIKDNTHAGEWDVDLLADWTADLQLDLGLDIELSDPTDRSIDEMDPIHYEKYDYVMIVCRNELDYNELVRRLGIGGKKVRINGDKRKIKARAIWYEDMNAEIVPITEDGENNDL